MKCPMRPEPDRNEGAFWRDNRVGKAASEIRLKWLLKQKKQKECRIMLSCSQISETIFTWRTESVLAIVKFCRYSLRGSMTMHKLMLWLSNILNSLNQLTQRSTALCLSSVAKSYCAHALFEATRLADHFSGSIRGHGGQHLCDPRISDWNRSECLVSVLKAFGSILKILFCASVIGGKIYLRSGNAFKNFNLSFLICSRQKHLQLLLHVNQYFKGMEQPGTGKTVWTAA